ncbi:MAG: hypothetical protein N4A57_13845 [Anaeromicrobium sp.]|jgi:hypothetical protein|uniref:hypothetical protein n=1 Tax=Anaeromicrobium sp. TaxID=1929132 RepID=UPI0025CCB1A7|nr:hypothetical protein [Anaeromicrobium sp.]MCT4595328.1 hypothetical protein [Anaeromicrobium sp.]
MKILKKDIICKGGTKVNEDIANINEYGAWVLDGATGLNGKNIMHEESDAKWFVTWWDEYISKNICRAESLQIIVKRGIKLIKDEFFNFTGGQLSKLDFPSSSIVIIRWVDGYLEYFSLGDVALIIQNEEKNEIIMDHKIGKLDNKVFKAIEDLMNREKKTMIEAKGEIMDLIIDNRLLKNREDGYWILGFDERASDNGLYGKIKVRKNTKIFIGSDGFYALGEKYNYLSMDELIKYVEKLGLDKLYNILRRIEEEDWDGKAYPRFKKNDDASAIYLEFEKS